METITRKSMLYKTGVEYGDYTMNHALGCAHGCKFPCYAFLQKKRFGVVKTYDEWCQPKIVSNTLELLDAEIPRLKDKIQSVHLCFSTDPFVYGYEEISALSLASIKKLNDAGIKCTVLTKGVLPIKLAELSPENEYGITLVSLDEKFRREWEPGTADYQSRIAALKALHEAGCKTWISMEPYPTPNIIKQFWSPILDAVNFADKIIFGRLNYNRLASEFKYPEEFYCGCTLGIKEYCERRGITCRIKRGTPDKNLSL